MDTGVVPMPPRGSPAPAALAAVDEKLGSLLAEVKSRFDQHDETVGELAQAVADMADEIKTLRIAIDDIRAELEWTMRNHAPRREPAIGLPVKSVPKPPPSAPEVRKEEPATVGRLF